MFASSLAPRTALRPSFQPLNGKTFGLSGLQAVGFFANRGGGVSFSNVGVTPWFVHGGAGSFGLLGGAGFVTSAEKQEEKDKARRLKEKQKEKAEKEKEKARKQAEKEKSKLLKEKQKDKAEKEREKALKEKQKEKQKEQVAKEKAEKEREKALKEEQKEKKKVMQEMRAEKARAREKVWKLRQTEKEAKMKLRAKAQKQREKDAKEKQRARDLRQKEREKKAAQRQREIAAKEEEKSAKVEAKRRKEAKPKRALTGYQLFLREVFPLVGKEKPEFSIPQRMSEVVARWGKLTEEEKKPYLDKAAEGRVLYIEQKQEYKKTLPPKKPPTAFLLFSNEHRRQLRDDNPSVSFAELGKMLGNKWGELDEGKKEAYMQQAEKLRRDFQAQWNKELDDALWKRGSQ